MDGFSAITVVVLLVVLSDDTQSQYNDTENACIVFSGSVPPFYREVYEIVCPAQQHVDHDTFLELLVKSSLPKQTLSQVSDYG